ncbi:hypothetical protein TRVL_07135 [Trypanosoma vivax]|nr:hypothetical protein TRVL_07135 [Trypanosoma vivax]
MAPRHVPNSPAVLTIKCVNTRLRDSLIPSRAIRTLLHVLRQQACPQLHRAVARTRGENVRYRVTRYAPYPPGVSLKTPNWHNFHQRRRLRWQKKIHLVSVGAGH